MLAKIHRTLKREGIKGVLDAIKAATDKHPNLRVPTDQEISKLAGAADAGSLLYPNKTFCIE